MLDNVAVTRLPIAKDIEQLARLGPVELGPHRGIVDKIRASRKLRNVLCDRKTRHCDIVEHAISV